MQNITLCAGSYHGEKNAPELHKGFHKHYEFI